VLQIDEVPTPVPQDRQVLIEVEAIGANVIDTVFRRGTGPWSRPLPGTLTGDVVGRVVALGPGLSAGDDGTGGIGVAGVAVGDRVAALSEDAFADYVTADAQWLAPVPDGVDAGEATVLSMTAPLALRLLRAGRLEPRLPSPSRRPRRPLPAGETVLVQAAAGGVGHLAVQLARILGAKTVIGTASAPGKLDFVRAWGADEAIDSSDPDWAEHVRAVAPGGVDIVLDAIGGAVFDQGLDLLAPLGRMVTYGAVGGALPVVPVHKLVALKSVVGVSTLAWRAACPEQAIGDLREIAELWGAGRLRTAVHATFPLTATARAHEVLDSRANLGRVIVTT
jgi:NADPH2:quinone reductase